MGFLPDSHPHKLMINYSMIKSCIDFTSQNWPSLTFLPSFGSIGPKTAEKLADRQTDGWTNPNYSMTHPLNLDIFIGAKSPIISVRSLRVDVIWACPHKMSSFPPPLYICTLQSLDHYFWPVGPRSFVRARPNYIYS